MSQAVVNILALLGGIWAIVFASFMILWGFAAWVEKKKR